MSAFLSYHLKVRNDDHCPICQIHTVSVHPSPEAAGGEKGGLGGVWIDEWVRRRNGDWYEIIPVQTGVQYKLGGPIKEIGLGPHQAGQVKWMVVEIEVNQALWCPDNIKVSISFHSTRMDCAEQNPGAQLAWASKQNRMRLFDGKPVWIGSRTKGRHVQLVPVLGQNPIQLNDLCEQIRPDVWFLEEDKSDE
jgi:hypothetical protein